MLDVAGQRKQDPRRRSGGVHFKKSWVVPEDVKVDAISAKVENGELVIELPRQKVRVCYSERSVLLPSEQSLHFAWAC